MGGVKIKAPKGVAGGVWGGDVPLPTGGGGHALSPDAL